MPKIISLIGLPGCGKTYWGRKLATHLNFDFKDLDELITQETNLSIAKIFEAGGEILFRKIETNVLREFLSANKLEDIVLALGGGTPAFNNNMQVVNNYSCSIYINKSIENITQHLITENVSHRPLIRQLSEEKKIIAFLKNVLIEREAYFMQADYMIYENELSMHNFDKIIKDYYD